MTVVIKVDTSSPTFAGLDPKHIRVVIGAVANPPMFYNFERYEGVGDSGTNNKLFAVSPSRPLIFEDHDFTLLGSEDPYHASRSLSLLIDLMRKGLVIVTQGGVELTPEDILTFKPA